MALVMVFLRLPSLVNHCSPVKLDSLEEGLEFAILVENRVARLLRVLSRGEVLAEVVVVLVVNLTLSLALG